MKLKDKVAIVTGAGSGIGKSIALLYAKEGAKVVVSDINTIKANETVKEIIDSNREAVAIFANVSDDEQVQRLVDQTVKIFGTFDILVNNAGIMDNFAPAAEIEDEQWERIISINTSGVMRATRKALSVFLKKEDGVIVNIASNGGLQGARAGAAYTASKHAVIGFTKNTGYMYAKRGIRCNAIAPGSVETNIGSTMHDVSEFGMHQVRPGMVTNPYVGRPEDVAKVALFLASDDSVSINGAVIVADAGWSSYKSILYIF